MHPGYVFVRIRVSFRLGPSALHFTAVSYSTLASIVDRRFVAMR